VLPVESVCEWMDYLIRIEFSGILNLEVFSPEDLKGSLNAVEKAISPKKYHTAFTS